MRMMTVARVRWRPILSPSGPKNNPPSGRMTKATPKTANEESSEVGGVSGGEKRARRGRPPLSRSRPKNNPPGGRMTKATPKTANEESSEMVGFSEGKKTAPSVTARYPDPAQAKHTTLSPTD